MSLTPCSQAEGRWQIAKDNYEHENTPLVAELTQLNENRFKDFDTEFKAVWRTTHTHSARFS